MSFIGATGLDEVQEQFDTLNDKIDANADYINNLVGIPDPTHTAVFGINILNPGLFGLVERAEVNIAALQTGEEGLTTQVEGIETQITGIEGEITGIQGEITTIQGEITGIEGEISLIQFTELPAIVSSIAVAAGVASDALSKANKSLGIWDEDGNNTYNMKSGNVAIGILPKGTLLNNKLEVNGSINIPTNYKYKINNVPLSYSDLAGTPPVSSKWTNATDVATNIYYSTGNVGIGITSAINNKLEVGGNINIPTGSKYKINNVDLSYNDLTNKLTGGTNISIVSGAINNTLTAGTNISIVSGAINNTLTAGTNISIVSGAINNTLTAGTNISIVSGAINNTYTYTLPTAGIGSGGTLGGVKVDNSTITITNGVISAAAATPQVNSDWTQTNTSLKSFILNKPTAGNNISFANNTITNTITGSTSQNIIGLNANQLIIVDKPNSQKIDEAFVPLTNEPSITSPAFTESIRTFTHSGGTETQTTYDITIPQNTICDILMIGGGGGGGKDRAGGGGAGALILSIGNILSGTYNIRVGNKGLGATTAANGDNGYDCEIYKSDGTIIFRAKGGGGGQSLNAVNVSDGGCGGGKTSQFTGLGGIAVSTNVVNGITTGPVITTTYGVYGNVGGRNTTPYVSPNLNNLDGAGGGGIGEGGSTSGTTLVPVDNQFVVNNGGKGGDGLYFATINGTTYNFKNYFNVNGVQDGTTGNFFIGGGGGGGDYGVGSSGASGKGGGGAGGEQTTTGANATGFGSGGGGGGGDNYNGGNGSAGIVVIKFRTIVNAAIPEGNPITHKTLNFTYIPNYPIIQADTTNLKAWYKFDGNYMDSSSSGFNLTNSGAVLVNGLIVQSVSTDGSDFLETSSINLNGKTYSISFWVKFNTAPTATNSTFFSQGITASNGLAIAFQYEATNNVLRYSHWGGGNDMDTTGYNMTNVIGTSWHHYVITYNNTNRGAEIWFDGVKLNTNILTLTNAFTGSGNFIIARSSIYGGTLNGLMEDFRYYDKVLTSAEISQLYSIPTINQYTLSVPLTGTGVIINNTPLQYISAGTYTISVGSTQSSVVIAGIGQVGSDPYPSQNGSTITFKYSMTQRTQAITYYKKDGLIKYVPASGTNPTTGTWQMFDVDSQALTQFAGNLPFTRIDGNVPLTRIEGNVSGKIPISSTDGNLPASRIDNLALSLGMDLTGVNGATQIKLTSAIVVVQGNLYSTGVNYFKYNVWHLDSDGFERFYFQQSNTTYLKGHGTTPFEFRNGANTNICTISGGGGLAVASYLQGSGAGGGFRLVRPDTWVRMKSTDETTHLNFAAQNLYAHGTLDAQGIINLNNFTYVRMQSIANTGNELVCVVGNDAQGEYYNKVLYIAYGTFTGFHRCYVEDELCNDENVDIFKNEYIGRVVISTGKIKTDASRKKEGEENQHEWYSLEGKEGITIEDALPIIQLSRVRKDKRVYGVLGDPKRGTNNNSRIIVNGCGEGAIAVADTNGNIENGDYIQTSDLLGYGERQDEPQHYNYTIAKAVMDCTFELDNPNYECKELASGVRVAMIACVYKAS